jgi:hypothetical protein
LNILGRIFHRLRVLTGLQDASELHITPSHGWLLAEPLVAREQRKDFEVERATRRRTTRGPA